MHESGIPPRLTYSQQVRQYEANRRAALAEAWDASKKSPDAMSDVELLVPAEDVGHVAMDPVKVQRVSVSEQE